MIGFIILAIILFVTFIFSAMVIEEDSSALLAMVLCIMQCALLFAICGLYFTKGENEPQAIDVYRGKTTLQITYQDSIPVDSVVVFKDVKK